MGSIDPQTITQLWWGTAQKWNDSGTDAQLVAELRRQNK